MKNEIFKKAFKVNWYWICLLFLILLIKTCVYFFLAINTSKLIADITNADISSAKNVLLSVFVITIITYFFGMLMSILRNFIVNRMYKMSMNKVFAHMNKLSIETMDSIPTGAMLSLISSDTKNVFSNFISLLMLIDSFISATAIIVYIFICSPIIGAILVLGAIICIIIGLKRVKKLNALTRVKRRTRSKYKSLVNECIVSEKDIKSLNLNDNLFNSFDGQYGLYKFLSMENEKARNLSLRFSLIFLAFIFFIVEIVLAFMLRDFGLPVAMAIFIYNYSNNLKSAVFAITNIFNTYPNFKTSCEKLDEFFDESIYKVSKYGDRDLDSVKGKIEFKNVNFSYEYKYYERIDNFQNMNIKEMIAETNKKPQPIAIGEQVLSDVNFVIEPNTKVAFVGFSGSGKTTILKLIAKFLEPTNGQVLIDDCDIQTLSEKTLRNNFAIVSQSTYIFSGTIKDNLLLVKPNATDEEINEALDKAFLTDFIAEQPNGIMTMVGENGLKLSGGQKQRLAIARAFLKDSKIVVFDESTSALDNIAQMHIQNSIDNWSEKTVVIVAHRLSTIVNVDKIFFLQNGEIVNSGTFDYLMNNDEAFKELFLTELA